jgi:hypothetical protein
MNPRLQAVLNAAERRPLIPLLLILLVGFVPRAVMLPTSGFELDLVQHYEWGMCGLENGLFGVYVCGIQVTHPPISPTLLTGAMGLLRALGFDISYFEGNAAVYTLLKLPNLLFETASVCLIYLMALKRFGIGWAIAAAAAVNFNPGLATVTSYWGQNDASYAFFMVVVAWLLVENRPRWMWLAYGLAWLAKFQSIMFLPVLVVFSFRRWGWRTTLIGLALWVGVIVAGVLPFYLGGSGDLAINPYFGTADLFPYIATGTYNFWYWISGSSPIALLDSASFIGGLSYFWAGMLLLTVGTALLCLRVWLLPERADEFLVLAAAGFSFFMLPTRIQGRYLYPALLLLALAMIRDWRLILLYVGLSITYAYNIFNETYLSIGLLYYPYKLMFWNTTHNAIAVTVLYLIFMGIFLQPLWAARAEVRQRLAVRRG